MTIEQEVANLTTSVDNLTDAVNVKKVTLDASVADGVAARDQSQAARDVTLGYQNAAQQHASDAAASATLADSAGNATIALEARSGAETARDEAVAVAPTLSATIGNLSTVVGQVYEEVDRISGGQQGNDHTRGLVLELASLIGALSDQINGGQASLRGGTLADPALRLGTVGIYSSASDTLSIAIAGSEVARFTASGMTVYGAITEVP